jgi:hypothetical protein
MHLQERIQLLVELGRYMASDHQDWMDARHKASAENGWFLPEFVDLAIHNITENFLDEEKLKAWTRESLYNIPEENTVPKNVGLIMAGNIPLVGFHDFLAIFISGHRQIIKTSSKDNTLIRHLVNYLISHNQELKEFISFGDMLKACDAYIATGSNNSARYFDYYFAKYPHIIRRNRTSVAIIDGRETRTDLEKLSDDVFLYFGLGCRNVTKLFVPEGYDFVPLLDAFRKYDWLAQNNKYKNNFDYQLTLLILNKRFYMSNESVLLTESPSPFSPISLLHFEHYKDKADVLASVKGNEDIQCVVSSEDPGFGVSQKPRLMDYADGVDSLQFLLGL